MTVSSEAVTWSADDTLRLDADGGRPGRPWAPPGALRSAPGAIRAAVYARLEEVPFRTGVLVLAACLVTAAIAGGAGAIVASQSAQPARPPRAASHPAALPPASPLASSYQPRSAPVGTPAAHGQPAQPAPAGAGQVGPGSPAAAPAAPAAVPTAPGSAPVPAKGSRCWSHGGGQHGDSHGHGHGRWCAPGRSSHRFAGDPGQG